LPVDINIISVLYFKKPLADFIPIGNVFFIKQLIFLQSIYNSNAEKTLLHLSYIRTAKQQCGITLIRFAFVRSILFRTFPAVFILDIRCGGTLQAIDSVSISWASHPLYQLSLGSIIILTRFIADFESYSKV
jgi:hypothetical protein